MLLPGVVLFTQQCGYLTRTCEQATDGPQSAVRFPKHESEILRKSKHWYSFLLLYFNTFSRQTWPPVLYEYNLTFEVFLETVAFWCLVIRLIDTGGSGGPSPSLCCSTERTCCFSLLLYRQNLLLLSATLEKPAVYLCYCTERTCCFSPSSRDRTCCISLLFYRQNLLLLSATLETEPAASLCYFTDRTSCFSLLL